MSTVSSSDWTYCGKCKKRLRTQVRRADGTVTPVCILCDFPERLPIPTASQVDTVETPD